jgi:two-component system sensor histidine kinase UhpB
MKSVRRLVQRPAKQRSARRVEQRDPASDVHELHVYQEEVKVQNQQLLEAQRELEEARDLYIHLYDFAPNGYLTIDANGVVLRVNLTGAALLGRDRRAIVGLPMLGLVEDTHRAAFLGYLRECRSSRSSPNGPAVELRLRGAEGPLDVQLLCRRWTRADQQEFFIAVIDISQRRELEAEREAAARQLGQLVAGLMSAQEEERRRIARDIHDDLGQQLTALRLRLELLAQAPLHPGSSFSEQLALANRLAADLDRHLDFFTSRLHPAALDDLGIVAALDQFVRQWSATFGVPAEFHSGGLSRLPVPPEVAVHLYRFAQEALHNVYKHANATRVGVILEGRDGRMRLIVEDDGVGFDARPSRAGSRSGGLGLVGMRERAALVRGSFHVESMSGQGTTVFLELPLK